MPRSRSPRRAREEQEKPAGKFERHADAQEPERSPDHSRPRKGPVVEKPREWAGWEIRPPRPPDKRSPARRRSPPRRRSPIRRRSRSPLGRRQLPPMYNRGPGVPVRRGPPPDMRRPENKARGSGNRGRSPSPPPRSPVRGGWRHDRSPLPPRGRSPRGPPPDIRRGGPSSPRRSLHGPLEARSRHLGDRRGAPPTDSHWPRSRSPRRALSRSPLRAGPSPRGSRLSPPVPRVPRDRRSPPKVVPPRPKHLRTPPPASLPPAQSTSPSPRRERREDRERSVEREKYGKSGKNDREVGRERVDEVKEHPSIPDEEADMSKSNTMTGVSGDWAVFRGPEMGEIDPREMKKIQIDIRRNLPPGKNKSGLGVDRDLGDPALLGVPRRPGEGRRQLFDRDEIREADGRQEDRETVDEPRVKVILEPLQEYERKLGSRIWEEEDEEGEEGQGRRRAREEEGEDRIPATERLGEKRRRRSLEKERRRSEEREVVRGDVRDRLGGRERSPLRERRHVKERLGEVVGRGEGGEERHTRGRGRGGYRGRGRGRGGHGHYFNKFEKYEGQQEEPTSTTD